MSNATAPPSTIVEFLTARFADPVGQGDPDLDCNGVGEYYRCDEWSEWHRRTIAAQRALLTEHAIADESDPEFLFCRVCHDYWKHDGIYHPCQTVRLLASVYSDHPDYREEWKP